MSFERAALLDSQDPLRAFRDEFALPTDERGQPLVYMAGNSLGLQPKKAREYVNQELDDWARLGVEGHFHAKNPWMPYHELVTAATARLVGALASEVVVMNSLTVNLHLMLVSFFRPTRDRFKVVIEAGAFPSDQYAIDSQLVFHGLAREEALIELKPRAGEDLLRPEDILSAIANAGPQLALVLLGNVNYLTGQQYDIAGITRAGHAVGAVVGFDLAHGAGNLALKLHDDGPDFAVWCNYKYVNAGPGAIAGCFVHERHAQTTRPRFAGWWGHDKGTRFLMGSEFRAIPGAEGWQLSNPPILQLAALRASLEIFDRATMPRLRAKADALTRYLETELESTSGVSIVSPRELERRGTQLSLRLKGRGKEVLKALAARGVICDFREPDIVRVAPAPLYTRFIDVHFVAEAIKSCLTNP